MDQCEDREGGVPPSKTTLCGEHESQTKAQRPAEPDPSCVSLKSNWSHDRNVSFEREVSDTESMSFILFSFFHPNRSQQMAAPP